MNASFVIKGLFVLGLVSILAVFAVACGSNSQEPVSDEPVSARVAVRAVEVSAEGDRVKSITVLTDDGKELTMILDDTIDPAMWGPRHLQGHIEVGRTLGFKVGIEYIQTPDGNGVT